MNKPEYSKELTISCENIKIENETITHIEYIEFLSRTDLGKQYPKEDFIERIKKLVENIPICLIARNEKNQIIGNCFGLTDFAYWLLISDLGIDRRYEKKGLGKSLLKYAEDLAGGEKNIIQILMANENALDFYKKVGMKEAKDIFIKSQVDWTNFEVNEISIKGMGIL
jgi:GNAT superfamily N-acetyltransferase